MNEGQSASKLIDERIAELGDWRGETLSRMRKLIKEADPNVVEEWKWRGVPVWSHDGILCTGETYKGVVNATFAKGASLSDPKHLFNASLDGNVRRAIDFREGEKIDEKAFTALIREAVRLNESTAEARKRKTSAQKTTSANEPPQIGHLGAAVAVAGQAMSLPVNVADMDEDALAYELSGLPAGAAIVPSPVYGQAHIQWTPQAGDIGTYDVTVTVQLPPAVASALASYHG